MAQLSQEAAVPVDAAAEKFSGAPEKIGERQWHHEPLPR
jgi:hypothetical protein